MIAARLHGARDLRVEHVAVPQPGPGDLLVRVEAAGVCGSDLHVWRTGEFVTRFPVIPGHEVVGVVASADGALPAGTRVVLDSRVPCGTCPQCRHGLEQRCGGLGFLGEACDGGFAPFVAVPATRACPVPADLAPQVAVLAEPAAVAVHARGILQRLAPDARRVGVLGAGPIGVLCALSLPGSLEVVIAEPDAGRAASAASVTGRPVVAALGDLRADAVMDCAGFTGSLAAAMAACRPGGAVLVLALHHDPEPVDANMLLAREHVVAGCHVFRDELAEAVAMLAADPARFGAVVSRRVGLHELPDAVAAMACGDVRGLKTIVVPEDRP